MAKMVSMMKVEMKILMLQNAPPPTPPTLNLIKDLT